MDKQASKKSIFKILKSKIYIVAIIVVSIFYVVYGLFNFEKTGKSLVEILGSIGMSFIIGLSLVNFLRKEGLKSAREDEVYKNSLILYADAKEKAKPYYDKLPAFCAYKTEQDKTNIKREIITNANLSYYKYLKGFYKDKQGLEEYQLKAIEEANVVKIEPYQTSKILSDLPSKNVFGVTSRYGIDEKQYIAQKNITGILSKIIWAILSGYYTLGPLNSDNIPQAVWNALQIAIWLAFGSIDYVNAKEFIVNEYRQTHIIQKTAFLEEFVALVEKEPEKLNQYDDELMFKQFLENENNKKNLEENKEKEGKEDGFKEQQQVSNNEYNG